MNDPQKPSKAPNQWLAQQESRARLHKAMEKAGIPRSTRPPLQPGSVVVTISFPSTYSQPPNIEPTVPDSSDKQSHEVSAGEGDGSVAEMSAHGNASGPFNPETRRLLGEIASRVVKLGAGKTKVVIARMRGALGATEEEITDEQLKPFAVAALKDVGPFKSRTKVTVQPVQLIAPLPFISDTKPPRVPRPVWREYVGSAIFLLIGQSFALFFAAYLLQIIFFTPVDGKYIEWKYAWLVLLFSLPGFLVLCAWTLTMMEHHPKSMSDKTAAMVMRVYLLAAAVLSWWLIDSSVQCWTTWAVIFGAFVATYVKLSKQQ